MDYAVIIADDLTGACDSGVKLHNEGYRTQVMIDPNVCVPLRSELQAPCILSVNTDTRSLTPERAYQKVKQVVREMKAAGVTLFYKKVDSVLRGNTGRELDAMLEELDYHIAVVAPAFPENGRAVVKGQLIVSGERGSKSFPALEILQATSKNRCGRLDIDLLRGSTSTDVCGELMALYQEGTRIVLADCETYADMKLLMDAVTELPLRVLAAGSAGLIPEVGRLLRNIPGSTELLRDGEELAARPPKGPVLLVVGTRHPVTLAQLEEIKELEDTAFVPLNVDALGTADSEEPVRRALQNFRQAYPQPPQYIVVTTNRIQDSCGEESGYQLNEDSYDERITQNLAQLAVHISQDTHSSRMILTGGATASAVFGLLGATRITLTDEPMPGIVAGTTRHAGGDLHLATKSGGFGSRGALVQLAQYMNSCTAAQ